MSKPHVCPVCTGAKSVQAWEGTSLRTIPCPACGGMGIVWEPETPCGQSAQEDRLRALLEMLHGRIDHRQKPDAQPESTTQPKTLNVTSSKDFPGKIPDVEVFGNPDLWRLVCKASSKSQGWMKSTKIMKLPGGVVLRVSTQQGEHVAEALCFVPCTLAHPDEVMQYLGVEQRPERPPQTVTVAEALQAAEDEHEGEADGCLNGSVFKTP